MKPDISESQSTFSVFCSHAMLYRIVQLPLCDVIIQDWFYCDGVRGIRYVLSIAVDMTVPIFPKCSLKEWSEAVHRTHRLEMITQKSLNVVNVNRFL